MKTRHVLCVCVCVCVYKMAVSVLLMTSLIQQL